jgi:hypothetical protein
MCHVSCVALATAVRYGCPDLTPCHPPPFRLIPRLIHSRLEPVVPQAADEIRAAICGAGRPSRSSIRSWDRVALLRLDDHTLVRLAWLTTEGVRLRQTLVTMAQRLPLNVSRYQLRLFLLCFFPDRSPRGPNERYYRLDPGPAECHIDYVMRTQHLDRRHAIAFIEDPAGAERAA